MSKEHPIIALTGSAGAGTTTFKSVFAKLFQRKNIMPTFVQGDSFRKYDFFEWDTVFAEFQAEGRTISHFGPEANEFEDLEALFRIYSATGTGKIRHYLQSKALAEKYAKTVGHFSDYEDISADSDVLCYDGFHGGLVTECWSSREMSQSNNPRVREIREKCAEREDADTIDVARHVDLLIGVTPNMNLEWIQKIQRDVSVTGIEPQAVSDAILRRMPDYISYIIPQFSVTDINFQRVPLVDTSDPFIARDIPLLDESMVIARFRDPQKTDFQTLLHNIDGAFMSRPNTMVIPGREFEYAVTTIFEGLLDELFENKDDLL